MRLRSLSSADRTSVWLRNVSDTAVHIIWLDYKGQEVGPACLQDSPMLVALINAHLVMAALTWQVSYGRLEPGGVSALYTFGNHPW